jgi:hypothetical protein
MKLYVSKAVTGVLVLVSLMAVTSYATSVTVTSTTFSGLQGALYQVTGGFSVFSKGFATAGAEVAASTQPCPWSNGGTCATAIAAGHFYYGIVLTLNTVPASTTTYTVNVYWSQNGGARALMGSLTVSVPTTAVSGQTMTFNFDTAGTSINAPIGIDVIVQ